MSFEHAVNFIAFFGATTAVASLLGIVVDRGVSWYRGSDLADTEL